MHGTVAIGLAGRFGNLGGGAPGMGTCLVDFFPLPSFTTSRCPTRSYELDMTVADLEAPTQTRLAHARLGRNESRHGASGDGCPRPMSSAHGVREKNPTSLWLRHRALTSHDGGQGRPDPGTCGGISLHQIIVRKRHQHYLLSRPASSRARSALVTEDGRGRKRSNIGWSAQRQQSMMTAARSVVAGASIRWRVGMNGMRGICPAQTAQAAAIGACVARLIHAWSAVMLSGYHERLRHRPLRF